MSAFLNQLRDKKPQSQQEFEWCAQEFLKHYNDFFKVDGNIDIVRVLAKEGILCSKGLLKKGEEAPEAIAMVDPSVLDRYGSTTIFIVDEALPSGRIRYLFAYLFTRYLFDFDERIVDHYYYMQTNASYKDPLHSFYVMFALDLLMPTDQFEQFYKCYMKKTNNLPVTIQKLAKEFFVDEDCVRKKLEILGHLIRKEEPAAF